ncbi:Cof-type HAD-IIB family hydrolase [Melissococcus plutonius]|uniref:Hydrolase (HAD superfamily) n=1 Tax=Melissococcus plutonius (strain ATCC 35311 / DSM 29964 / CIP 104052 / LMG 20360 / NCIMB 702443) TaxID=940190 RepID=F3Y8G1_MELPT|nr:Cof-type HAD-IIB family hydrolase [Melissococcus plutonius]KMT41127.1 sugar phosphatase YidA [Melissococcus plutonius]MBB5177956.1 hypothetical protein [Melissococcus plutonius]BAK20789.1 hydrolase (HAD superfamily) [Melissococcus plutonius ATCC 35311]BBD14707.1 HAD superfamily hydrolase [Melissococcus plutonius]
MIKLIAIDLDGTLLNDKKKISIKNKETIARAKALGIKIVICTGRPLKAMEHYLEELNLLEETDYCITFNGGLVQKTSNGEIIKKALLPLKAINEVYLLAISLNLPFDVLSDHEVLQLPSSPEHPSIYNKLNNTLTFTPAVLNELTNDRIYNKIVMATAADYLDRQIKQIPHEYYDHFEIIKTRKNLLEFMPKGITKAYGLSLLADELMIKSEEIMAIGDEENDLPMIHYAGIGVAMENAVSKVRSAADIITTTNEKDGVASAIENYAFSTLQGVKGGI